MNILLVYPETPVTFWSFKTALKFVGKKSSEPPLGLITIAAMLPAEWNKKLIDMNVRPLTDAHIRWADYVFLTGMDVHRASFEQVVRRCKALNKKVVAGGPMVTAEYQEFSGVDHFILNEAEITLPMFLKDLRKGQPKQLYSTAEFPDLSLTPIPQWDLLETKKYMTMSVQYSRGCPFDCEFCAITMLNGHVPRTKSTEQFLAELESLYRFGWRGNVFVVDDNFIGNKKRLKNDLLPALVQWSQQRNYPFSFLTEASVNLADDEKLMQLMVQAGFDHAFIGIETPDENSLAECGKKQNRNRDLLSSVRRLHRHGLRISGGFIVGFDSDPENIFERQVRFIQQSGIVTAMVGLLNAAPGTRLFRRLKNEGRLTNVWSGNNMDGVLNFIPKMDYRKLLDGYRSILRTIYDPAEYYRRVITFLNDFQIGLKLPRKVTLTDLRAFVKSIFVLGIADKNRKYYWKLLGYCLVNFPEKLSIAVTMAIYGLHFRKLVERI